jgi:hypothetical protein
MSTETQELQEAYDEIAELKEELESCNRVIKAAKARLKVWTTKTYDDLVAAVRDYENR